eukprot:960367_1
MVFRLLLLIIVSMVTSGTDVQRKEAKWSIKCMLFNIKCCFCQCLPMDETSGPDPHFQRNTRNKTIKMTFRESEESTSSEEKPQQQSQLQRSLRTPTFTQANNHGLPRGFNLNLVDEMPSIPESVSDDGSETTGRTISLSRKESTGELPNVVPVTPLQTPLTLSKERSRQIQPFTRSTPSITNPLIPAAIRNRSTMETSDDPLFTGIPPSNQKQIIHYCKIMLTSTIFPLRQRSNVQEVVLLNKACLARFVELFHMVEQAQSSRRIEIVVDEESSGKANNTVIALDLSSIVSTHGEVKGVATEDDLMELLQAFTSLNAVVRNKAVYTPWVYSVVQRHSMPDVYAVYSYRNHFMKFMDTVRDDTVGVYVNLNVNNSLTVSGSRNGSILAHLYHVVALEMIYNHAQSGTPFEFAFVSFPAADEQHAHAIFHVLSAWPQRFWSSATRLMIVDSNGDKAWDVITPEELDEELRCKKMRLRNFVPILAKQAPSFRLAHDPSILVVTASRIKLDLIRGTFEQIANDNFWLHAQMMGEVLTGGYRRPWLHNSVAKVISWTDTEMGGDLTTV